MTWQDLAQKATQIYDTSLKRTLELFPFDANTQKAFDSLPLARGKTVEDYGLPAKVPIDVFNEKMAKKDLEITQKDPYLLVRDITKGKYSCVDVLTAYFHAAMFASKLVNCVYEFLPEEALQLAKKLDLGSSKDLPLMGLPLSLKEMIPVRGRAVTHGSLCFLDRVVDYDADIVNILVAAGAVPFVRTTNPQSLMMLECESWTHGRTVNPYNSLLTCGGSSGGEGAINGIGASAFGLGSDIGGSIRCPSAFNGIYGLRSTVGRLPSSDYFSCQLGSESILSVTGPMTRSLDLLDLVMKTIADSAPWLVDPSLAPLPWNRVEKKKYKIGVLYDDGVVAPQPPIARALKMVADKLSKFSNVEIVPFKPYKHEKAWEIITSLYFEDGGADTKSTVERSGEPMLPQTEWILSGKHVKPLQPKDIWHWNLEKGKYRREYLAHWLAQGAPDAVIAPVFPGPACKPRTSRYWGYTAQWNLLDYPAVVFPVGKVEPSDEPVKNYKPRNEMDEFVWKQYDSPASFENAPVSLCAVGLRNTDDTLVAVARLIEGKK